MNAIDIRELQKSYGPRAVLHRVSFAVPAGSIFGFLGPNGAGKTTTIRILLGLLRASGGAARVFGRDVWHDGPYVRRGVGYLPGDVRFYDWFTGRATLEMFNAARGGGHSGEITRLQRVFDLDLDKKVRRYSRGMKQKLGLIQALMHKPRLLILDEPTTALDPLVREALSDELRAAAREGRSILFSSHTLTEVEELCDEVAIVRGGKIIENERISVLRQRAVRRVEVMLDGGRTLPSAPAGLRIVNRHDGKLTATWVGPIQPLLQWLSGAGVSDVSIAPPDLEDLFMTYYADAAREPAA
jgi:ABC-2 type transport system ATP-binding protein